MILSVRNNFCPQDQALSNHTVHHLFEEQVRRTPNNTAVRFKDTYLTYFELNKKANQLAHIFIKQGVKPDTLVAICVERSLDMIIGILGILKAGGAYAPIDPDYPRSRVQYILKDTATPFVFTQKKMVSRFNKYSFDRDIQFITLEENISDDRDIENPNVLMRPDHLIYVIYTSGSTGKPKGVMNEHKALCNRLLWMQEAYQLNPRTDRVLQKTPFTFDVSGWEFFWPLITGAVLIFAEPKKDKDLDYLLRIIIREKITTVHFVPSIFHSFLQQRGLNKCNKLKRVICSGEPLYYKTQQHFYKYFKSATLYNLYGPTEAAIDVTAWRCRRRNKYHFVPIGHPIANIKTYILDEQLNPVSIGEIGELHIGGVGLARGYLNCPKLTTEKFIKNPFSHTSDADNRLYKTGDLVRQLPDGNLEYIDRKDDQVKIRGFRVEPGEVNFYVQKYPSILQSIILTKKNREGKYLVVYLVGRNKKKPDLKKLYNYLKRHLPDYMIPNYFVLLDKFPFTMNQKIDHEALKQLEEEPFLPSFFYVPPSTDNEKELTKIYSEILHRQPDTISIYDSFFELGGHSLSAMRLLMKVNASFLTNLTIQDIFEYPSVFRLNQKILFLHNQKKGSKLPDLISYIPQKDMIPLSYFQQQLWFFTQLEPDNPFYNIPLVFHIKGALKKNVLEKALSTIIKRHDILRTTFITKEGQIYQHVIPRQNFHFKLPTKNVSTLTQEEINTLLYNVGRENFSFSKEPPIRLLLLKVNSRNHILMVCMHHIITDSWSIEVFNEELSKTYQGYVYGWANPLSSLPTQYATFTLWQREYFTDALLKRQLSYWKKQLDNLPMLNLPTDYPRPAVQTFNGKRISFKIPQSIYKKIKMIQQEQNVTLFTLLLSAFNILLNRYTGQTDIVIGSPIAHRKHPDLAELIGFFVNTVVLRSNLSGQINFLELLQRNRKVNSEALKNNDIPFDQLVNFLHPERNLSRNPLFQIMFALESGGNSTIRFDNLNITYKQLDIGYALFDLTLLMKIIPDGLEGTIEYNTNLFYESTIERLIGNFKVLLREIVRNPECDIANIPILSKNEKQVLLIDWNDNQEVYPDDEEIISHWFEKQVERTPDNIAVTFGDLHLTYRELDRQSNQLAHYLIEQGVKPETLIAVLLERTHELLVVVLGVLKAGCAYIPLDPSYPSERIAYIFSDSGADILLIKESLVSSDFDIGNIHTTYLDSNWPIIQKNYSFERPDIDIRPYNLAYVMYTSGSTGKPKGVQIEHIALSNFIHSMQEYFSLNEKDNLFAITPISFDISGLEFYLPITQGARCVIAETSTASDAEKIKCDFKRYNITIMQATPVTWSLLVNSGWVHDGSVRVLCGGEKLDEHLARKLLSHDAPVWNLYGPTETTIWSICYCLKTLKDVKQNISIGSPIANTTVYVLAENLQLLPIGAIGELYIGGVGLARGYLNQPLLTKEKFLPNPFSTNSFSRLYKTGDLVRWLPEGTLEYFNRLDHQVKVHGNRIELEEIEYHLRNNEEVDQAIVVVKNGKIQDKHLVAYIVSDIQHHTTMLTMENSDWKQKQMDYWQSVWQTTYEKSVNMPDRDGKVSFNTAGWISSYTNKTIPLAEMNEWVNYTVLRILDLKPKRVLEIGCGLGLLLFKIAPKCQYYVGSDFSSYSLEYIAEHAHKYHLKNIELINRHACDFSDWDQGSYDTIIINSVAQYFPNIDYLENVLERALFCIIPHGGYIFLGDIRNLDQLDLFYNVIALYKARSPQSASQLKLKGNVSVRREKELVISPQFFLQFAKKHAKIKHVDIQLKRGTYDNEMNCFRYDVILYINKQPSVTTINLWEDWEMHNGSLENLKDRLINMQESVIAIQNIPNGRLTYLKETIQAITNTKNNKNVKELEFYKRKTKGIHPELLYRLAEECHCMVNLSLSQDDSMYFDAVFSKEPLVIKKPEINKKQNLDFYANTPLLYELQQELIKKLRKELTQKLPAYMIPSQFILLNQLSLTPNGKIDRMALNDDMDYHRFQPNIYISPRTEVERQLFQLWSKLLNTEKINIYDNFFDLGGHSILAIQFISAVKDIFSMDLSIKDVLEKPTIVELAEIISNEKFEQTVNKVPSSLVILKRSGHKTPIFLIHPISGTVFCYKTLVKHLSHTDRPIYGLQDPEIEINENLFSSLPEMATFYLKSIKRIQPKGPYLLGGASFGGVVAVEMEKQLRNQGEHVEFIGLFDSWAESKNVSEADFKAEIRREKSSRRLNLQWKRKQLLQQYTPSKITNPIILFKAENTFLPYESSYNGWDKYVRTDLIKVFEVPGDHYTIFEKPNVQILANILARYLNNIEI